MLGGGFGGKCGFHYESHIAVLARKAARPVRLLFTRREEFLAPDKRREGMVIEIESGVKKDGTITARRGYLVIDNGAYTADSAFFSELAAMHVARPVQDAERLHRRALRVHEPPALRLGARAHGAAGLLGARAAHRRDRERDRHGSRRVPPPALHRHRRRGPDAAGLPADRPARVHRQRRRDEQLRPGAARGRGDRPRRRLVADVRGAVGRVREAQLGRLGRDHHGRAGVRHRLGHDAADAGRRRARHAARGLHARLPGHRRRPVGHGRDRLADARQQRPRRRRGRQAGRRSAPPARGRPDGGRPGRHRARGRLRPGQGLARQPRLRRRPRRRPHTAASCCSAPARARLRRGRRPTTRTASARSAWMRGRRRRSAATPCA